MKKSLAVWVTRLDSENIVLQPIVLPDSIADLDAATTSLPGGAYTTLRTYQGDKVLCLKDQIRRLEQSARLAREPVQLNEGKLRTALAQALRRSRSTNATAMENADLRLRLTLDLESHPGDLYIVIEPLEVPSPVAYRDGVAIVTSTLERLLPEAKLTRFITRSRPIRQSLLAGINEAVMVNPQGFLMEGLTSNFFAVAQGEICTADKGVLAGITRELVLENAHRLGISISFQPVHISELANLQEAFITSSSRGVLPVCRVDSIQIGAGKPGLLTRRLKQAYDELILRLIEPVLGAT